MSASENTLSERDVHPGQLWGDQKPNHLESIQNYLPCPMMFVPDGGGVVQQPVFVSDQRWSVDKGRGRGRQKNWPWVAGDMWHIFDSSKVAKSWPKKMPKECQKLKKKWPGAKENSPGCGPTIK